MRYVERLKTFPHATLVPDQSMDPNLFNSLFNGFDFNLAQSPLFPPGGMLGMLTGNGRHSNGGGQSAGNDTNGSNGAQYSSPSVTGLLPSRSTMRTEHGRGNIGGSSTAGHSEGHRDEHRQVIAGADDRMARRASFGGMTGTFLLSM